jgi:signal transduction histidine kinase
MEFRFRGTNLSRTRKLARTITGLIIDSGVAAALTAVGLMSLVSQPHEHDPLVALVCAGAGTTSVAWRRRAPLLAALVSAAALLVLTLVQSASADNQLALEPIAMGLDFYMLGRSVRDSRRMGTSAVALFFAIGSSALGARHVGGQTLADLISGALIFIGLPFVIGLELTRRKTLSNELIRAASSLEREQELHVVLAASEERNRIARELHDVIAHDLSVMVIQTSVARRKLPHDRSSTEAALRVIVESGHNAIEELRRIMGVIRREDQSSAAAPGLSQLDALIARTRAAGMPVEVSLAGNKVALSPGLDLIAYRIIQEALTNAIKHAGPAEASVRLNFEAAVLELEISDSGRGASHVNNDAGGPGYGLLGMRERVHLFGGELQTGPGTRGGFTVRAWLPLAPLVAE